MMRRRSLTRLMLTGTRGRRNSLPRLSLSAERRQRDEILKVPWLIKHRPEGSSCCFEIGVAIISAISALEGWSMIFTGPHTDPGFHFICDHLLDICVQYVTSMWRYSVMLYRNWNFKETRFYWRTIPLSLSISLKPENGFLNCKMQFWEMEK